jgi:hypothetical protein
MVRANKRKGDIMSIVTKIALSAAILIAASAASAATRQPTHNHVLIGGHRITPAAYLSFGTAVPGQTFGSVSRPAGSPADYFGDPYNRWERKCFAGTCSPDWRTDY